MLLLLLACSAAEIAALKEDLEDLEDQVNDLEDELEGQEGQPADTGAFDTGDVPPMPGTIAMDVLLDNTTFTFGVELSEPADVELYVSWTAQHPTIEHSWSATSCSTLEFEDQARAVIWGYTHAIAEVTWPNGAWSCAQVVGVSGHPVDGCTILQPRTLSCE